MNFTQLFHLILLDLKLWTRPLFTCAREIISQVFDLRITMCTWRTTLLSLHYHFFFFFFFFWENVEFRDDDDVCIDFDDFVAAVHDRKAYVIMVDDRCLCVVLKPCWQFNTLDDVQWAKTNRRGLGHNRKCSMIVPQPGGGPKEKIVWIFLGEVVLATIIGMLSK